MTIDLKELRKDFGDHRVLHDMVLSTGEFRALGIIGPSGGGKTTLLRILAGLENPTAGEVIINGNSVDYTEKNLRFYRQKIGMVFQNYNLFPHMDALENIAFPLIRVHGVAREEAREKAHSLLERFRLEAHGHKKPGQLSGGQKQRVALSRAVAVDPDFLLLDEPTSALDPEFTAEVLDMIAQLHDEGKHFVVVTHNMGFARKLTDAILFVGEGGLTEFAPSQQFFESPRHPKIRDFLGHILKY